MQEKFAKDYWLRDQIRRAIVSVSSNIVEGFERDSNNEFARFLKMAKWSLWEVRNQLYIAHEVWYINESTMKNTMKELTDLWNQIWWFIKYLKK